jgi:hypothetical protein
MIYQKKGKATTDNSSQINAICCEEIAELKRAANIQ